MANWGTVEDFKKAYPIFATKAYQFCKAKNFPAIKAGGTWAINLDELDRWLLERKGKAVIPPREA